MAGRDGGDGPLGLFGEAWHMSLTMAVGSFVAGSTSEGGGAVAFPVMTLFFEVESWVARDFALMIQSVGMNSAAFAIFALGVAVERRALLWASLGGAAGVVLGLELLDLPSDFAKVLFVSTWLAFALALYWVNRYREREVMQRIERFLPRHAALLLATGLVGGLVTSVTGSGLDICTFSLLVLRLRICEKVATPTSVALMGFNSAFAFAYRELAMPGGMAAEAWRYWWVCVPIVAVGAPLGAWFIRERSRRFVAGLLYVAIVAQFGWAVVALELWRRPGLAVFGGATFLVGTALFAHMARRGVRRLSWLAGASRAELTPP